MALAEFDLIARYFRQQHSHNAATHIGIGDDCAVLDIPEGFQLVVTTDTMVENLHFFSGVEPQSLGHKILAVNLSDLAAMGAKPLAVTLAITLPTVDEQWLKAFSKGFMDLAQRFSIDLVGGDTTTGPLTLTVQAMGLIPKGKALTRAHAQPGDLIFLSGPVGDAGLGLKIKQGFCSSNAEMALLRLQQPEPMIATGLTIRQYATACIDISDGLLADLGHILANSHVSATIDWEKIPMSAAVCEYIESTQDWQMPLTAGDDYELCFTVAPEQLELVDSQCQQIGVITTGAGMRLVKAGVTQTIKAKGFEHFS